MLPLTAIKTILIKLIRNVKLTTGLTQIYAKTNNPVTNVESRKSLIFLLNGVGSKSPSLGQRVPVQWLLVILTSRKYHLYFSLTL